MNPESLTLDTDLDAAPARKLGFYETLVMRAFSQFTHGGLRMTWPDGHTRVFGAPGAAITAEIRVRDPGFFKHVALFGNVGFGESYVHGDWDTDDIAAVIAWFIASLVKAQGSRASSTKVAGLNLLKTWNRILHKLRPNSITNSRRNIAEHYDLGNEFYSLWLDQTMTYSAARFESEGQSLEEAQH